VADDRDDSQKTEEPTQRRLDEAHRKGDASRASSSTLDPRVLALAMFGSMSVQRFAADLHLPREPGRHVINAGNASALLEYATYGLIAVLAPAVRLIMFAASPEMSSSTARCSAPAVEATS
jgi:flagellar biosynthesis protein FlhB